MVEIGFDVAFGGVDLQLTVELLVPAAPFTIDKESVDRIPELPIPVLVVGLAGAL